MSNPIPEFDHNLVLPPHLGNPADISQISPYKCSTLELCERFSFSTKRVEILKGFISFRIKLHELGLHHGFQWIDGSFLENVESRESRSPNDLDLVTIYWGYDFAFQEKLCSNFPEFADSNLSKEKFMIDHYPFDAGHSPSLTVDYSRYWIQLFSHNRDAVWKGMLQIELNTNDIDIKAIEFLNSKNND